MRRHQSEQRAPGAEGALALDVADRRARDPVLARRFLVRDDAVAVRVDVAELRVGLAVAAFRAPVQRRHRAVFPLVGLERRGIEREFGLVSAARDVRGSGSAVAATANSTNYD